MRLVSLRNDSGKRLAITAIRGLVFSPGEVKKVSPATVKHPAVSSYIGRGLTLVTTSEGEEPKAPIPTSTVSPTPAVSVPMEEPKTVVIAEPTPAPEPEPEPVFEPLPEPEIPVMETPKETAGDLQEAYLAAPGITEENLVLVYDAFPTYADLASASPSEIQSVTGLTKTTAKKLRDWAAKQ